MYSLHRGQKTVSGPLELRSKSLGTCHLVARNQTWVLWKDSQHSSLCSPYLFSSHSDELRWNPTIALISISLKAEGVEIKANTHWLFAFLLRPSGFL